MKLRESGRRLGALLVALGVQVGIALLLFASFTVIRLIAPAKETIIHLSSPVPPPPALRPPLVIDARPRANAPPSSVTTGLPPVTGSNGITTPPDKPPPSRDAELMQKLRRAMACQPDEHGKRSPFCPPELEIRMPDPSTLVLNPPSGVKDEERWAEEKRRGGTGDTRLDLGGGVSVGPGGPGVSLTIQDPLCKLAWVLFAGGFKCGAPPRSTRPATEEQFQSALAAYHRRRGGGPKPALTSKPAEENGNEKARPAGPGAGAGNAPGTGSGR